MRSCSGAPSASEQTRSKRHESVRGMCRENANACVESPSLRAHDQERARTRAQTQSVRAVVACAQSLHVRIRCMGAFVAPAQHSARTAKSVQQFGRNDNAGHVVILLI